MCWVALGKVCTMPPMPPPPKPCPCMAWPPPTVTCPCMPRAPKRWGMLGWVAPLPPPQGIGRVPPPLVGQQYLQTSTAVPLCKAYSTTMQYHYVMHAVSTLQYHCSTMALYCSTIMTHLKKGGKKGEGKRGRGRGGGEEKEGKKESIPQPWSPLVTPWDPHQFLKKRGLTGWGGGGVR